MPTTESASNRFTSNVRERTRDVHDDLEQIMSTYLSCSERDIYRGCLKRLLGVWRPMELAITRSSLLKELPYLSELLRTDKLINDLKILYGNEFDVKQMGFADFSEMRETPAAVYGLAYVWAGSIHGAQVLAVRLRDGMYLDESNGASFFALDDPMECRQILMQFYAWLDANLNDSEVEIAIESARKVYQTFIDWYKS